MRRLGSTIAIAAFAIAFSMPAALGATFFRTWVSHSGSASNAPIGCPPQNPCDTFATALGATNPGGEINCVDNGSYGPVTITQSVTIDCSGQLGTIDVSGSASGVIINSSTALVKLRNLTINGNGTSGFGINIQNAAAVTIENCVIGAFDAAGIQAKLPTSLQLNITDTLIANNSGQSGGILVATTGSGTINFIVDRVRVENTAIGVAATGSVGTGAINGFIRDSVVTGTTSVLGAIAAATNANTSPTTVSVYRTHVVGNTLGISSATAAAVILSNSTIQGNGRALASFNNGGGGSGGAIFSYGNNDINGNQPGGIGTVPTVIAQH